jgi:hypothetical protein
LRGEVIVRSLRTLPVATQTSGKVVEKLGTQMYYPVPPDATKAGPAEAIEERVIAFAS